MKYLTIALPLAVLLCVVQALPNYRSYEPYPRRTWPAKTQFDLLDKERDLSEECKHLHELVCDPPTCEDLCLAAPCGSTCKARIFGKCVIHVPKVCSCAFRYPDAACEAERLACSAVRHALEAAGC